MSLILLYGLPGSGKTSLGNLLFENKLSHHISCGNLIKENNNNYIENNINKELLYLDNYPKYLSLDGLKLHDNNNLNILKNITNEFSLKLVIFIDNISEKYVYLENKNVKKIKNHINYENYNSDYMSYLSERLLNRGREDDTIEIVQKRLYKNKKISVLTADNIAKLGKYMKFNILILNVNNSINDNYNIVKEYL